MANKCECPRSRIPVTVNGRCGYCHIEELEAKYEKLSASVGRNVDWVEVDGERVYTSYDTKLKAENARLRGAAQNVLQQRKRMPVGYGITQSSMIADPYLDALEQALQEGE